MTKPTIEIICRAYHGDERKLFSNLLATANVFVNRREFRLTLVLDDESEQDHALGDRILKEKLVDRVLYEALPENWTRLFKGIAFPPPYNRPGYDRQQWSTFHMDRYSDADIIGVVDSDATFFSYLTSENVLGAQGRIKLHVVRPTAASPVPLLRDSALRLGEGSSYCNDQLALREPTPYEAMGTDRMPVWLWRSTYSNLRALVEARWKVGFDEAFEGFASDRFSQFNILANYVLLHERARYDAIEQDDPSQDIVCVCQNGCLHREDLVMGGIRSFGITGRQIGPFGWVLKLMAHFDVSHINRYGPMVGNPCAPKFVRAHYANVDRALARLSPAERQACTARFLDFLAEGIQRVQAANPSWYSTYDKWRGRSQRSGV